MLGKERRVAGHRSGVVMGTRISPTDCRVAQLRRPATMSKVALEGFRRGGGGGSVLWKTGEAAARLSGADSDGDGVDKRSVPFYRRAWGQYGRRGGLHMGA
jgi:hypothetical protein